MQGARRPGGIYWNTSRTSWPETARFRYAQPNSPQPKGYQMSADNTIVVLSTLTANGGREWRVAHMQAAENLHEDDAAFVRYILDRMFSASAVFTLEDTALDAALELERACGDVEYGVRCVELDVPFPTAPEYVHDCADCTYLGRHYSDRQRISDLYVCKGLMPTVIARFSDEGSDYTSGLCFVGGVGELTEAHRRAVARGLLPAKVSLPE